MEPNILEKWFDFDLGGSVIDSGALRIATDLGDNHLADHHNQQRQRNCYC